MAVRNFYLKARIDGRKTLLTGGPRAKDGGFDLQVTVRHNGQIIDGPTIMGREIDRQLFLHVFDGGREVFALRTDR